MTQIDDNATDPVTVATTATEFEAQTKAAVLEAEGITCRVVSNSPSWTGQVALSASGAGAVVLVAAEDADRAGDILKDRIADSVDLDWDEIDVGEREDTLPLRPIGSMPMPAKIAATVTGLILIASVIGGIIMMIL